MFCHNVRDVRIKMYELQARNAVDVYFSQYGLDESDNADSHKSVLGNEYRWGEVVRQHMPVNTHNICNCVLACE